MVRLAILICSLALLPVAASASPDPAELLRASPQYQALQMHAPEQADGFVRHNGLLLQTDPYGEGKLETRFELLAAHTRQAAPLVLVLTPYRGQTFADTGYAETLARSGLHTVIVAVPKEAYQQDQGIDYINRFFLRHTLNTRALAHALQNDPLSPIKVSRIGLIGTSLGGIRGSILFGIDKRFEAAVLIVPGGDLPNLIANTILEPIARWRERQLSGSQTFDPFEEDSEANLAEIAAFEQRLRPHVHIDPLRFVRRNANKQLLWVRSDNDGFVPRINQDRLFNAYAAADTHPPAELSGSGLGHYATILAAYQSDKARITGFLIDQLCTAQTCAQAKRPDS